MKLKWNFQRGGEGTQTKNPPWEGCGYYLKQHVLCPLDKKGEGRESGPGTE